VADHFSFPTEEEFRIRLEESWKQKFVVNEKPAKEIKFSVPKRKKNFIPYGRMESRTGERSFILTSSKALKSPPTRKELLALDLFAYYMGADVKDSWEDFAKKQGWISRMGIYSSSVNNLVEIKIYGDLVDSNVDINEVLGSYLTHLNRFLNGDWNVNFFESRKTVINQSLKKGTRTQSTAMNTMTNELPSMMTTGDMSLDWLNRSEAYISELTPEFVKETMLKYLDLSNISFIEKTPALKEGENTIFDGRKFQRFSKEEATAFEELIVAAMNPQSPWSHQKFNPISEELNLSPAKFEGAHSELSEVKVLREESKSAMLTHYLVFQENKIQKGEAGLTLSFFFPMVQSVEEEVLLDLWASSLREKLRPLLDSLYAKGQEFNFTTPGKGELSVSFQGELANFPSVLKHLLEGLKLASPSKEEFEAAKNVYIDEKKQAPRFSTEAAEVHLSTILSEGSFTNQEMLRVAERLSFKKFKDLIQQRFSSFTTGDTRLSIVGDLSESDAKKLYTEISGSFANRLSESERNKWLNQSRKPGNQFHWRVSDAGIDPLDQVFYGVVRLPWKAHELFSQPKKSAAVYLLNDILADAVFARNRDQLGLGYTHSGRIRYGLHPEDKGYVTAFGASKKSMGALKMLSGWRWVYNRLMAGDLMEKVELDFEGAKQNLFRVLNDQSDTLFQMATFNNAASNRSLTDNLNWRKEIAKQVMGLTIEDVQSVAKEIFENNPEHLKFLMSGESPKGLCQKVLEGN